MQKINYLEDTWVVKLTYHQFEALKNYCPDHEVEIMNLSTGAVLTVRVGDLFHNEGKQSGFIGRKFWLATFLFKEKYKKSQKSLAFQGKISILLMSQRNKFYLFPFKTMKTNLPLLKSMGREEYRSNGMHRNGYEVIIMKRGEEFLHVKKIGLDYETICPF